MSSTNMAIIFLCESPKLGRILFEVLVYMQSLVENEFWVVNIPCYDELVVVIGLSVIRVNLYVI